MDNLAELQKAVSVSVSEAIGLVKQQGAQITSKQDGWVAAAKPWMHPRVLPGGAGDLWQGGEAVVHSSKGVVGGTGNHTSPQALGDRATGGVDGVGLIGWALAHMIKCGATAILVAPQWEAHNWWPWLLQVKQLVWPLGRVHDMVILGLSGVFKPVGVVCISHQEDSGQGMADLSTWVQELLSQARAPGTLQTYTRWVHEFSDFVAWTTGAEGLPTAQQLALFATKLSAMG